MREIGSEFEIGYARDYYFDNLEKHKEYFAYTRSGREAIGLAAKAMVPGVILMPAYCCWSMELPFEEAGWQVEYYRLNFDLSVDRGYLQEQIDRFSPKAVLVMNYCGFVPTGSIVDFIKSKLPEIKIIEDFTQCLFTLPENFRENVDFYVASVRKSLGVSDGGVILSSYPIDIESLKNGENTPFISYHRSAGRKKSCYLYSKEPQLKNEFRNEQGVAGKDIKDNYGLYHISDESLSVMRHSIVDIIKFARIQNYKHLYEKIHNNSYFSILFEPDENNTAPFMMILLSDKRDELQKHLAKRGVYAQVLWPLKQNAKEICAVSGIMERKMLALPIDQRYNWDDIEEMAELINGIVI